MTARGRHFRAVIPAGLRRSRGLPSAETGKMHHQRVTADKLTLVKETHNKYLSRVNVNPAFVKAESLYTGILTNASADRFA